MKVLHLNYHENSGGAAIAAHRIHQALIKQNIESLMLVQNKTSSSDKVFCADNLSDIFLDKINLYFQRKMNNINLNHNNYKVSRSYNLIPTFKLKHLKKINPDIVNLHWVGNNFIDFKEISLIDKPIVWTLHDMWPYCGSEHYSFENRYKIGYEERMTAKKKKYFGFDLDKIVWMKKKNFLSNKINFVPTSSWQERKISKSMLFKNSKIKKIFYPINFNDWKRIDKNKARRDLGLPQDKKIFLFISERIDNPMKGLKIIKEILDKRKTKDFCLVILGRQNKELFQSINFEFKFINQIHNNNESLVKIYSCADLLLAPSLLESFGIVALEAACCNLPSIVFSNTGFEDTIKHKINGYIAKNSDPVDFKNGIEWCLNEENYKLISKDNRNLLQNIFDESKIAKEYENFYRDLIYEKN